MTVMHVVSMSSGKDSTATAVLAIAMQPREALRFVACDTGNEHEEFRPYLEYLEQRLGITVEVLRADLSGEVLRRRDYIREHWPAEGMSQGDIDRAVAALVPTGNPFLDLCLWKGRFPSRRAQFCTQHLKTEPLVEHQMAIIERGEAAAVWSWQGVRIDESTARRARLACPLNIPACDRLFEVAGGGLFNYRPILRWTVDDVLAAHRHAGIEPNPLYRKGMTRVGCMPCINASKDEVLTISKRFPQHIERIAYWEACVKQTAKRQDASFFPDPHRDAHLNRRGIHNVVGWAQTGRGGQTLDWIRVTAEPKACESAYGLCD